MYGIEQFVMQAIELQLYTEYVEFTVVIVKMNQWKYKNIYQ